ncbi:MAG: L-dopachrome tautomerase-related protein, partial [Myxococcota bacterium]
MQSIRTHASFFLALILIPALVLGSGACSSDDDDEVSDPGSTPDGDSTGDGDGAVELVEVASSQNRWTGVAVSQQGRLFVSFPRWSENVPISVGEVVGDNRVVPYPNADMQTWAPGASPTDLIVSAQSVYVDDEDFLWILDTANVALMGVVEGGPKLIKVDLGSDEVVDVLPMPAEIAPLDSYLNDVRVDTARDTAYLTDSNLGVLVVVDLQDGSARRVLIEHPSTKSEDIDIIIDGEPWMLPGGIVPDVQVDGLALDPNGDYLYYQALTGQTLYRIPTEALRDPQRSEAELAALVENLGQTGPAD